MEDLFQIFLHEWSVRGIQQVFNQLCVNRGVDPTDASSVYEKLKHADRFRDRSSRQRQLWELLDKRREQKVYQNQSVCRGLNVLVVGAGPCGLRAAIECALLGANVVVAESRDKFTRNNVLHLWKFVIEDLKSLGAKLFMPRFCTGDIDHISIKKLHSTRMSGFVDLIEPQNERGWRARFDPHDHILSEFEFDAVIGASGKHKCLPTFKHKVVRGKLAIGITANFVRHRTKAENDIPELQGVAYVYRQHFFDELRRKFDVKLENIVYYKSDETHYFVMCAEKANLIAKGVIKRDVDDVKELLLKENIDTELLCKYLTQVVDYATDHQLSNPVFALNARRQPDVAYEGHPLILTLVGDYLHEPFWPTGTGIARGFLSVLDTAWLLRNVGVGKEPMAKILAEREATYSLLSQTQPNNLSTPSTLGQRYTCYQPACPRVDHLMGVDDEAIDLDSLVMRTRRQREAGSQFFRKSSLFRFCYMAAQSKKIRISSFGPKSWSDGRALAALISKYRPDFQPSVDLSDTTKPAQLCLEAFDYAEDVLHVPRPCATHIKWAKLSEQERIAYLRSVYDALIADPDHLTMCMSPTLFTNFRDEKKLEGEKQARALRPRQLTVNIAESLRTNFDFLNSALTITKRKHGRVIEDFNPKSVVDRRSSVDRLHPELVYKINQILADPSRSPRPSPRHRRGHAGEDAESTAKRTRADEQQEAEDAEQKPSVHVREVCTEIETGTFAHSPRTFHTPSRLDLSLQSGSLAGVQAVTKFREKFDTPARPKRNGLSASAIHEEQHPADPMNVRQTATMSASNGVVYRSTTQHQFGSRPFSVPHSAALDSPALPGTFGHQKPPPVANSVQRSLYSQVTNRSMRLCALCKRDVYLAEQLIVDRLSVHKQCLRCAYCNRALTSCTASIDRELGAEFGPSWFCSQHSRLPLSDKLVQLRKVASKQAAATSVAVVSPTKAKKPPAEGTLSFAEKTFVGSSSNGSTASSSTSLNEYDVHSIATQTRPAVQHATQTTPRPPTPPRKAMRPSSGMPKKRLSDSAASSDWRPSGCRADENKEALHDHQSDGSLDSPPAERRSLDGDEEEEYESDLEYVDAEEDLSEAEVDASDETWGELLDFLERTLADQPPTAAANASAHEQARELVETFNRRSLLSHFGGPKEAAPPLHTPRKERAETTPDSMNESAHDVYVTPPTSRRMSKRQPTVVRRSSTIERKGDSEVDELKAKIQQKAGEFKRPTDEPRGPLPPTGVSQTPRRIGASRARRGPRRATVAIDLKREFLGPEDGVATANVEQTPTASRTRRSPSTQRTRALHIRPTDSNLERVKREIEAATQRRLQEVEVRMEEVRKALCKDRRNKWELEQWLIYSQQFEELQAEQQKLRWQLQLTKLDAEYKGALVRTSGPATRREWAEVQEEEHKRLMELLLEAA
ncbi:F-actin monooxygenase [Aphelenchoides fujianensis]|nr:F-actin monooxygenase [Aphelenchoides fujianensis]